MMSKSNAVRLSCPECRLQFEPSGRSSRCPVCGSRVESRVDENYQSLPPLPAGLQARVAGAPPMTYERQTRWGLAAATVLFFMVGLVAAVNGVRLGAPLLTVAGALLLTVAIVSFIVSKGWQVTGDEGIRRHLADLPLYLAFLICLTLSVGTLGVVVYGLFEIHLVAGTVAVVFILICCGAGMAYWGKESAHSSTEDVPDGFLFRLIAAYGRTVLPGHYNPPRR
ncbi:MAG: hypothetical protein AB7P33_08760 [Dehalococcoidia bacterium]